MPKKAPEWLSADIAECYERCQGNIRAIQQAIKEKRGVEIAYMTISNRMDDLGLERPRKKSKPAKGERMSDETTEAPELLPGKMSLETADIPAEVHYGAVGEFDTLPEGYAKTIQPMREYTEAEEAALNESMRLYGFIGAIVRDQYGRILDGNQRQRIARLRGLGVPYTITQVKDDAHALAIATAANVVRRRYTREQREQIASAMREQGFSYRVIAEVLGVSHTQARADVAATAQVESTLHLPSITTDSPVPHETPNPVHAHEVETTLHLDHASTDVPVSHETPTPANGHQVETNVTPEPVVTEAPIKDVPLEPERRVRGRDQKSYPAKRPTETVPRRGQTEETRERMGQRDQPNASWINVLSHANRLCSSLRRLPDLDEILESWGPEGRQKAVEYLRPLYGNVQDLLSSLKAIDSEPFVRQESSEPTTE
jgi:transposase